MDDIFSVLTHSAKGFTHIRFLLSPVTHRYFVGSLNGLSSLMTDIIQFLSRTCLASSFYQIFQNTILCRQLLELNLFPFKFSI